MNNIIRFSDGAERFISALNPLDWFFNLMQYERPRPVTLVRTRPTLGLIKAYEAAHPELAFHNRVARQDARKTR